MSVKNITDGRLFDEKRSSICSTNFAERYLQFYMIKYVKLCQIVNSMKAHSSDEVLNEV